VLPQWLDAIRDGGRLLVPLTCEIPGMPSGIGKGMTLLATRDGDQWTARPGAPVAIYSFQGERDAQMQAMLGKALMDGAFLRVKRLRRDPHAREASCCLHGDTVCLASA
jgi:protein-L-isoaspartate(D-aspartate) O-methyltransferase